MMFIEEGEFLAAVRGCRIIGYGNMAHIVRNHRTNRYTGYLEYSILMAAKNALIDGVSIDRLLEIISREWYKNDPIGAIFYGSDCTKDICYGSMTKEEQAIQADAIAQDRLFDAP